MKDPDLLALRKALRLGEKRCRPYLNTYGSPHGLDILRQLIGEGFGRSRDEVFISVGPIFPLEWMIEKLLWKGDCIIADSPFTHGLPDKLDELHIKVIIADLTAMPAGEIEVMIAKKKPRFVYCKNGYRSPENRIAVERLAKLANSFEFWFIEDSSQISVHSLQEFLPSFSLAASAPWAVHIGSCKELLRLPIGGFGYVIASKGMVCDLTEGALYSYCFPPSPMQETVYEYFKAGQFFSPRADTSS
ncbi:MAG: hypothetical protein WBE76_27965 [Terracidiphilus sp.]